MLGNICEGGWGILGHSHRLLSIISGLMIHAHLKLTHPIFFKGIYPANNYYHQPRPKVYTH
nr:MAG TPA: hypothetical protein [Caudoviricetes sp.]